jgi:hypothetical protein
MTHGSRWCRRQRLNAQCEKFNDGNPEHQHCERYRIVFEPNTHNTPPYCHRTDPLGSPTMTAHPLEETRWFIKVTDSLTGACQKEKEIECNSDGHCLPSETSQFRQYADEAMSWAIQSKTELARTWMQAAAASEPPPMGVNYISTAHRTAR